VGTHAGLNVNSDLPLIQEMVGSLDSKAPVISELWTAIQSVAPNECFSNWILLN